MLRAFGFLLRLYSYLFHLILSLFLLGIAILSYTSHQPLDLGMLPFTSDRIVSGVFLLGVAGLLATALAITRIFRYLFPVWAAAVLYLMVRGFILSPYRFPDAGAFKTALWLILAAAAAVVGALWTVLKRRRGRLYR